MGRWRLAGSVVGALALGAAAVVLQRVWDGGSTTGADTASLSAPVLLRPPNERIFDVEAPGFRAATAIGAVSGAVVALILVGASMRLARRRRQVRDLTGQLSERERAERDRERAEDEDR